RSPPLRPPRCLQSRARIGSRLPHEYSSGGHGLTTCRKECALSFRAKRGICFSRITGRALTTAASCCLLRHPHHLSTSSPLNAGGRRFLHHRYLSASVRPRRKNPRLPIRRRLLARPRQARRPRPSRPGLERKSPFVVCWMRAWSGKSSSLMVVVIFLYHVRQKAAEF